VNWKQILLACFGGLFALAFGVMVVLSHNKDVAYARAKAAFESGRPGAADEDRFAFVVRGIEPGMTVSEVDARMANADDVSALLLANDRSKGTYLKRYSFHYEEQIDVILSQAEKTFFAEYYDVYLDDDELVSGLRYRVFDSNAGMTVYDIDCKNHSLQPAR
jgi:hypothetical protein